MTSPQAPIGSGFTRENTATDVLAGLDLTGRVAVVTGGSSGIGIETTRALAAAGATVVVPARRLATAQEALAGIDGVEVAEMDLADQASVAAFAADLVAGGRPVDLLVNNAGVMAAPETRVGEGWELQFATNHLGHYALTNRLWPALAASAAGGFATRVVGLSSSAHHRSPIVWDDVMLAAEGAYDPWIAYGQSKTANVLFALHLDTLAEPAGVRAFSVNPGGILTPLQRHLPKQEMVDRGWIDEAGNPLMEDVFKTPPQGAATTAWAATSPSLAGMGGVYCDDVEVASPAVDGADYGVGVTAWAVDPVQAARLWALSAELTGVDAFA